MNARLPTRYWPQHACLLLAALCFASSVPAADPPAPAIESELIFPLNPKHNHAPGIAELPTGEILASWYRGSGERRADDVAVWGSWKKPGSKTWSEPFILADTPGFPDGNTALFVDRRDRLWLFWPQVIANTWESCITNYRIKTIPTLTQPIEWDWQGTILLHPDDFAKQMQKAADIEKERRKGKFGIPEMAFVNVVIAKSNDKLSQRLGWQTRCKPIQLESGRILLPLYSDTYSACLCAISDDDGKTWFTSQAMIGFGNIQATLCQRKDKSIVAYMRENGPLRKIRTCESKDAGMTWSTVVETDLPNPGAGIDAVVLHSGEWVMIYNDRERGRNSLALSVSSDEGKTWPVTRHLEQHAAGSYHYPAIIQGRDGKIHAIYTYAVAGGESMKYAAFDLDWIRQGDPKSP